MHQFILSLTIDKLLDFVHCLRIIFYINFFIIKTNVCMYCKFRTYKYKLNKIEQTENNS